MKQSQKNIQIVKVQVGDLKRKRKGKKKTKRVKKEVFSGTGLAPVLGQTQYFTPPMFPTSRAGTQFEPPKQQVVEKKEEPLKDDYVQSLEQLKKLQEYMKGKGDAPSPFNVPSSAPPSPFQAGDYWTVPRFTDTPQALDRPPQPLLSAQASTSSSSSQQYSRPYLRTLTLPQLKQLGDGLGINMPPLSEIKNREAGQPLLKERYVELIYSYRPNL